MTKPKSYTKMDKYNNKRDLLLSKRVIGATSNWKADLEARSAFRKTAVEMKNDLAAQEIAIAELAQKLNLL